MRVLVTYGSKRGGTEGLAQMVAKVLSGSGHEVEVRRAEEIDGLEAWDAVVVGGALYAARWHREARRFVQRHVDELRQMPVWFFSSGPLDDSATQGEIAPTRQVSQLMQRVNARGHVTLGGRLAANTQGFVARAMVKNGRAGDWRDEEDVSAWAHGVAAELSTMTPRRAAAPVGSARARRATRRIVEVLCLFTGLTAIWGGIEMELWPAGDAPWFRAPTSLLEHSPFRDFLIPGLLLLVVVGIGNLIAGLLVARRHRLGAIAAVGAGAVLTVWIVTEMVMLRTGHWLQWFYLVVGVATLGAALWLWRHSPGRGWGTPLLPPRTVEAR